MPQQKFYGSLFLATPANESGGSDYTLVNDSGQKQWPLGGIYVFADGSQRPRCIKYVQYNPTGIASHGPIATLNATPTNGGSSYAQSDVGKVVAITSGGINGAVTITEVNSGSGTGAVTKISTTPALAGQNFTVTTGLTTAAAPSGGTGLTVAPTVLAGWQQGSPLYYKDETRTIVTNVGTEAATYLASAHSAIFSFAGIGLNSVAPTVGNYIWVQTGGYNGSILMPASTTAGDILVLSNAAATSPTDNVLVRVAGSSALTLPESINACVLLTTAAAAAGGLGHGWIFSPGLAL